MSKNKFTSWCYKYCWLLLLAGLFIDGVGLWVVIHLVPKGVELDLDYYGVIVDILSLLVTILIGWNIYSVIDLKRIKKEHMSAISKIYEDNRQIKIGLLMSRGQIEEDFAIVCGPEVKNRPLVIPHTLKAINCWAEIGEYGKASNCVKFLLMIGKNPSIINCSEQQRNSWMILLKSIPNQQKIENIEKIYILLSELGKELPELQTEKN